MKTLEKVGLVANYGETRGCVMKRVLRSVEIAKGLSGFARTLRCCSPVFTQPQFLLEAVIIKFFVDGDQLLGLFSPVRTYLYLVHILNLYSYRPFPPNSNNWLFDPVTIRQARYDDLRYAEERELALIGIFFANCMCLSSVQKQNVLAHVDVPVIGKLGKRLALRQQVIATANVYFRRFYMKSSYCDTDPFFVAAACCYVAAKVEETPIHLKNVVTESRSAFTREFRFAQSEISVLNLFTFPAL